MRVEVLVEVNPWIICGPMFVFMVTLSVFFTFRAKQAKNNLFYMYSCFFVFFSLVPATAALGQYILSFILLGATAVIGISMIQKRFNIFDEAVKTIENSDDSEIVPNTGSIWIYIINLKLKYGVHKAPIIFATIPTCIVGIVMLFMTLLCIISLSMAGVAIAGVFFLFIVFYMYIKEARLLGSGRGML